MKVNCWCFVCCILFRSLLSLYGFTQYHSQYQLSVLLLLTPESKSFISNSKVVEQDYIRNHTSI